MHDLSSIHKELLRSKTMIVITGPTASGKTRLSLDLAELLPIEVISADSRQIYKYMDIGTAKPTVDETNKVTHHYIDYLTPDEDYNAGRFGDEAEKTANYIFQRGKVPVIVGGSGLYIRSLCDGLFIQQHNDSLINIRDFLTIKLKEHGKDYLYDELKKIDTESALKFSDKNPRRVLRALEHYYAFGNTITESQKNSKAKRIFNCKYFGLGYQRQSLYERINKRTEEMWKNGLILETEKLLSLGFNRNNNSMNTVGYKETSLFLHGKYSEEQTIQEIKKNTRRYAKRQITWFKKDARIFWIYDDNIKTPQEKVFTILDEII